MNKYPGELRPTVRSSEIVVWEWECFINFKEGDAISPKSRRSARVRSRKFPGKPRENEKHSSAALTHAIIQEIDDSIFVFRVRNFYAQLWNPNFQKEHNNRCYYYNGGAPLKDSSLSKKSTGLIFISARLAEYLCPFQWCQFTPSATDECWPWWYRPFRLEWWQELYHQAPLYTLAQFL